MSSNSSNSLVTQIKLDLKEVMDNLKLLQCPELVETPKLLHLKEKTQQLLTVLENKPLEKLKLKIKKQQKRRQRKKIQHKKQQTQAFPQISDDPAVLTQHSPTKGDKTCAQQQCRNYHHHHLRSLRESQRFLKSFELLEQLHLARGQDPSETKKFSIKLQQLKTVWNSLLQEQQAEQFNSEQLIEQQWNLALFGKDEKSYFEDKPNMKYFLRKRHIWDSFIDKENGTSIPIGWVLPPLDAGNEWSQYLAEK